MDPLFYGGGGGAAPLGSMGSPLALFIKIQEKQLKTNPTPRRHIKIINDLILIRPNGVKQDYDQFSSTFTEDGFGTMAKTRSLRLPVFS